MRIICDAPGQTCNRLWTYVASVAKCIAEHKKMVIIFFDWTIEDFPNLKHCPFIFFPLYNKWYLESGNGWNNYKGLTWKVTHNKHWDCIFRFLGCTKGWETMKDSHYLKETKRELQQIFRPRKEITDKAEKLLSKIKNKADFVRTHTIPKLYEKLKNGSTFGSIAKEVDTENKVADKYYKPGHAGHQINDYAHRVSRYLLHKAKNSKK